MTGPTILQRMMQAKLAEDRRGSAVKVVTFGRSAICTVTIDDVYASPQHCRAVQYQDGSVFVEDLFTTNGTFLNGEKLPLRTPILLLVGDVLRIGRTELPWKAPASGNSATAHRPGQP